MTPVEKIGGILRRTGTDRYGAECVSQLQHALQCATLAENEGASPSLIAASLMHDIGHLVDNHFDGAAEKGVDRRHEQIGRAYLAQWFGTDVTDPVVLHVPAKRYLCAVDSEYLETMSSASVRSLNLQGGAFNALEASAFIMGPHAKDAVKLRRWDEASKIPDARTPPLEHFLCYVEVASRKPIPAEV